MRRTSKRRLSAPACAASPAASAGCSSSLSTAVASSSTSTGRNQQRVLAVAQHLAEAVHRGGDDRTTHSHGLEHRERRAFHSDAKTCTSRTDCAGGMSSQNPANTVRSAMPKARASSWCCARRCPSPTMTNRTSGRWRSTRAAALRKYVMPFCASSRPIVPTTGSPRRSRGGLARPVPARPTGAGTPRAAHR